MAGKRSTYAELDGYEYRLKAAASLIGVSENTLKSYLDTSGIVVKRQSDDNPSAPAVRQFTIEKVFEVANWRREQKLVKPLAKRPVFIAIALIKGGVGKTTTAAELGVQFQLSGYKTLLIDLDSQANLTHLMGYEADLELSDADAYDLTPEAIVTNTFATICEPALGGRTEAFPDVSSAIKRPFGPFGPALIPADTYSSELETRLAITKNVRELVFDDVFQASAAGRIPGLNINDYDVVIMDCAPSVSFVTTNALAIADLVIAPVRMDLFAVKGLSKLMIELGYLAKFNRSPDLFILPTHYSQNIGRVARMQNKLQEYRDRLSTDSISVSEEIAKALEYYVPLTLQRPSAQPVKEYRMVTEALVSMLTSKTRGRK